MISKKLRIMRARAKVRQAKSEVARAKKNLERQIALRKKAEKM